MWTLPGAEMYNEGLYFTTENPSYEQIPSYPLCTESQTESCQLSFHLTTWNKFLVFLGVRLEEVALGRLGFVSLDGDICRDPVNLLYPSSLLRWLLKEHRCISTLHFKGAVARATPQLGCDIMHANHELTSLQLSASCCRWPPKFPMQMVDAIRSLTQLQELELSRVRLCRDSLDLLATILVKMQNLRSFVFYHVKMTPTYRKLLLQAVKNTPITALHVDSDYLCPGIDDVFAEYLGHNALLKSLTITKGVYYSDDTIDLSALFVALKTNETLTELLISDMIPWNIEGDLLVESMTKNSTLETLRFTLETLRFLIPTGEAVLKYDCCSVASLATVIRQNGTLRNLDLDFYIPSYDDVKLLLEALACNKSLERVTLDIQLNMIVDAYRLVRETGTKDRVNFRTDAGEPELFGDALKGCTNSVEITFYPRWTSATGLLHKAFQQFTFCRHLVQLNMRLYKEIDSESAQSFASFLSSTNTLRGLYLDTGASVETCGTLMEGLSRNKSISVLFLTRFPLHKSQLHSWEKMFQDNTVLRDFSLYLKQNKAPLPVVSKFPRFLANNYTLLIASFWESSWFEPHTLRVQDIVRRNVTLLHRAADFAVGQYTKRCAEAFERMRCHESLVGRVQELDHGTERDAAAKISRCKVPRREFHGRRGRRSGGGCLRREGWTTAGRYRSRQLAQDSLLPEGLRHSGQPTPTFRSGSKQGSLVKSSTDFVLCL
ncbi:unnamed protein product [Ixodes pacificus]